MSAGARLADRIAVVVGAGQTVGETIGNGRATSITFAREGARLVLVDREPTSLEETASLAREEGASVTTVVADVSSDDGPAAILTELTGPDAAFMDGQGAISGALVLFHRGMSIAGGTSEIKRNQIGERILGLPRDPLIK